MRKAGKCEFITTDEGKTVVGVVLTGNFCAEHEFGIQKIRDAFGIGEEKEERSGPMAWWRKIIGGNKPMFGIDKRIITKIPEGYQKLISGEAKFDFTEYSKGKKSAVKMDIAFCGMGSFYSSKNTPEERFIEKIKAETYSKNELEGWWSEEDFLFSSENKEFIKDIYEAFLRKDIAMWTGAFSDNPFSPAGFIIAIASRVPEEGKKTMFEADEDYYNLKVAAQKTGIYEKLEKADKRYFALSPRWKDEEKKEVKFWLNPYEQRENNSGWYSVSDLEEWIEGKGPIPKQTVKQ
jgi:hypothetical protein